MDNKNKKCSSKDHEEIEAICYCPECKIYLCNKCETIHSTLFQYHHPSKSSNNISELFNSLCEVNNHKELLEFYCKTHNCLCCGLCITKLKKKGKGQHSNCDVCLIEDIKEQKKDGLMKNINCLKDLSKTIETSINELKSIILKINKNKEQLKTDIQKIFTKIRNIINNREDELLLEVDKEYDNLGLMII